MENMDMDGTLVPWSGAMGVGMTKSTMKHPMIGMGCFARVKVEKKL